MSSIEWTEETWNPVVGCTRVSAGCDHCYAVRQTHRLGAMAEADRAKGKDPGRKGNYVGLTVLNKRGERHFNGTVRCVEEALTIPLGWKKPRTVFVNSMGDLFHEAVPFVFIDRVFAVMKATPRHTYQVLTKRPDRMREYFEDRSSERADSRGTALHEFAPDEPLEGDWPLPNVWLGTSVEDQRTADDRIPDLLACPSAVRFLSCEPLLGPVDLNARETICKTWSEGGLTLGTYIDWVITGGESGGGSRFCDLAWIRSIVEQCRGEGVPVFVKQLGAKPREKFYIRDDGAEVHECLRLNDAKGGDIDEWPEDLRVREMPRARTPRTETS